MGAFQQSPCHLVSIDFVALERRIEEKMEPFQVHHDIDYVDG